jgi:hypothetical protein
VLYVMRFHRESGRWKGVVDVIQAVHRYERRRGYGTIGEPRMRRALTWLVQQGYVTKEPRKPFTKRVDRYLQVYVVNQAKKLPADSPTHQARKRSKDGATEHRTGKPDQKDQGSNR